MSGIIKRLPEFVANQIAAGEVVQRPASVVKELMENAIDAGSSSVIVRIQDGGRELIQVIDDGEGMSFDDAVKAFERHATSKITAIEDLFALRTLGFRGEALASISSVAEIEMKTRREDEQLGTCVVIQGGELTLHEPTNCPKGTQFAIKNLFYNVPARRKFLKKDSIEANHAENEFFRVALCHPEVALFFYRNDECKHNLPASNLRQRIANLTRKNMNQQLIDVFVETSIVNLHGFVGKPESAKKNPEQYFFVNGRFFRSFYFQKAVMQAYQNLLPNKEVSVPFFLYMNIDPSRIDVNIHPTKTEIKFEDEQAIWQIILAAIRESLGKYGVVPMIDFEMKDPIHIPVLTSETIYKAPDIDVNPHFNPFDEDFSFTHAVNGTSRKPGGAASALREWNSDFETEVFRPVDDVSFSSVEMDEMEVESPAFVEQALADGEQTEMEWEQEKAIAAVFPVSPRYAAASIGGRMVFVDCTRAAFRVAYERFLFQMEDDAVVTQQELFPIEVELSSQEYSLVSENKEQLHSLGFEIGEADQLHTITLQGIPAWMSGAGAREHFEELLHLLNEETSDSLTRLRKERLAYGMARIYRRSPGHEMPTRQELRRLLEELLQCKDCNYTPDGRKILATVGTEEIENLLK